MRLRIIILFVLVASVAAAVAIHPQPAATASQIGITASASAATVSIGTEITYTVVLTAGAGLDMTGPVLKATLPDSFAYISETSRVNGMSVGDPAIIGSSLKWKGLPAFREVGANPYGINTFVQDSMSSNNTEKQLNWGLSMAGDGGFVKQLFYNITTSTQGPKPEWIEFVNAAYDHNLTPIIRMQGKFNGTYWVKPAPDADGTYKTAAAAYKRVVQGLPRRPGHEIFVEIWNEPNLNAEWSGHPDPREYGRFFRDTARAIRSLGYPEVKIMNAGMGPDVADDPDFLDQMLTQVPVLLTDNNGKPAFDYWAAHPYPQNHPPEYNYHNGCQYPDSSIDSYWLQLIKLGEHGLNVGTPKNPGSVRVVITETGYELGNSVYAFETFAAINENNRADYMKRAFRDYWSKWPEIVGVAPYELSDPYNKWSTWDWVYPDSGSNSDGTPTKVHAQYNSVASTPRALPTITIQFRARAGGVTGESKTIVTALSNGIQLGGPAYVPVSVTGTVNQPVSVELRSGILKSGDLASLAVKDFAYYVTKAQSVGGTYTSGVVASFKLISGPPAHLAVRYAGHASNANPTVKLQIFNLKTGTWDIISSNPALTTDTEIVKLVGGNAADYVNSSGDVQVRIKMVGTSGFQSLIDVLRLIAG
jgi:uncharacterized repeat protein (TIGR01451 family)